MVKMRPRNCDLRYCSFFLLKKNRKEKKVAPRDRLTSTRGYHLMVAVIYIQRIWIGGVDDLWVFPDKILLGKPEAFNIEPVPALGNYNKPYAYYTAYRSSMVCKHTGHPP